MSPRCVSPLVAEARVDAGEPDHRPRLYTGRRPRQSGGQEVDREEDLRPLQSRAAPTPVEPEVGDEHVARGAGGCPASPGRPIADGAARAMAMVLRPRLGARVREGTSPCAIVAKLFAPPAMSRLVVRLGPWRRGRGVDADAAAALARGAGAVEHRAARRAWRPRPRRPSGAGAGGAAPARPCVRRGRGRSVRAHLRRSRRPYGCVRRLDKRDCVGPSHTDALVAHFAALRTSNPVRTSGAPTPRTKRERLLAACARAPTTCPSRSASRSCGEPRAGRRARAPAPARRRPPGARCGAAVDEA